MPRPKWGSRIGFILAAAGSAVGLGSVWRFPYYTGRNGGAAFVLVYLVLVALVGLPVQWLELSIGRATGKNPVGAYEAAHRPGSPWRLLGYLGILVGIAILSYYTVVAGWTVGYIVLSAFGSAMRPELPPAEVFHRFTADPLQQVGYLALFMALSVAVVWGGVKGGIERVSKVLMPLLVVLMLGLIVRALTLPQAAKGLAFYLKPDFSKVTGQTILLALGQSFYALSLGMGAMLTYGSYLDREEDLAMSGFHVVLFVTLIALMAGLIVFPVVGGAPKYQGPGLVFVALVKIFRTLPAGTLVAVVFFLLLAIAALTSTISLVEVVTAYLMDEHGWRRPVAVTATGLVSFLLGVPSALAVGASKRLTEFVTISGTKLSFLDVMDFLFGNLFLAIGVLFMCLFAATAWDIRNAEAEITRNSRIFPKVRRIWRFSVLYLAPLAVTFIIVYILTTGKTL